MNNNSIKLLVSLKNASLGRKERLILPCLKMYPEILTILYREGFIQSFFVDNLEKTITVKLRYSFNKSIFSKLEIISKPSRIKYLDSKSISRLSSKRFVSFFSTTKGLKTDLECKKEKLGGKLLFIC
jgi:small subunit ribosomal protein S8